MGGGGRPRPTPSIALVVLGAWDVFDLETGDGTVLTFGTPAWDAYVRASLQEGIDALVGAGAQVALLEVPCMRPISVEGAAVPPLPERGDDARVAHVNDAVPRRRRGERRRRRRSSTGPTGAATRRGRPTSACAGTACTSTSPAPS